MIQIPYIIKENLKRLRQTIPMSEVHETVDQIELFLKEISRSDAVDFKFRLGQTVKVTAMDLTGTIVSRCEKHRNNHTYMVIYYANGDRRDEWMYEFELEEEVGQSCQ